MAKFTKEQWERLAHTVGLPEKEIEETWQEVLKIREEEAQKDGGMTLPTLDEGSDPKQSAD